MKNAYSKAYFKSTSHICVLLYVSITPSGPVKTVLLNIVPPDISGNSTIMRYRDFLVCSMAYNVVGPSDGL